MAVKHLLQKLSELRWLSTLMALPVVIASFLIIISFYNFLLFHTLAELFAIGVALLMCIVAWQSYSFSRNGFLMFLASGYFWVGGLDLFHTLVYKGMSIFPITTANTSAQIWIAGRYMEALLLLIAPLFLARATNRWATFLSFGAATAGIYSLIISGLFPEAFIEGHGLTSFKIYSEYIIIALLAGALVHLVHKRDLLPPRNFWLLGFSILLTMAAELSFTYYVSIFGLSNIVGHVFKFFSYWLIFAAIIHTSLREPYRLLEQRIDERTRELRDSEAGLNKAQEMSHVGSWQVNMISGELNWTDEIYRIFGHEPSSFLPSVEAFHAAVHPDDLEKVLESEQRAEKTGVYDVEHRIVLPDGTVRHVDELAEAETDAEGKLVRMTGTIQDITKRKESEQVLTSIRKDLRDTVSQLKATLESTTDGILVVSEKGKIEIFNQMFVELWGLPDEIIASQDDQRAIGFVLDQLIDPQVFINKVNELYNTPEATSFDQLEFKDGRIFERHSRPKVIEDKCTGRVWSFRDVTDMETAKQSLIIAKTEAETANQVKSEFLSSMSHELRTPLNAVLGFAQLMEHNPREPLTKKQNASVDHILRGGNHLLELIDKVLELNTIEAGKLSLNFEDIAARNVIDDSLSLIQARAMQDGIKILDQSAGKDLPLLWTDSTRLTQVLLNLLSNAVKYNREKGTVTIACEELSGQILRINIADTGPGIALEKQKGLFLPFERLGRETGSIEGTGIGLTITKRIVELMGGQIGYESKPDQGSTFWVDLPLSDKATATATATAKEEQDDISSREYREDKTNSAYTILYVEDNPDNMQLMESIIEQLENIQLLTAYNAELGFDLARSNRPDLILIDINLPGMNGMQALKQLQETEETKDIPVIAITAKALPMDIEAGREAGFKDYITKPFDVPEFIRTIEETLDSIQKSA